MEPTLTAARTVAPGRILRRELEARGWSQKDLASILQRPEQAIAEIVQDKKRITPETAIALAAAFGTSPQLWTNLEANYRLAMAQRNTPADDVSRRARLYECVPVRKLLKRGWISAGSTVADLERAVCEFLGIASIDEEPKLIVNMRHTSGDGIERPAQRAWVRRVEQLAARQSVGSFAAKRLLAAIPALLEHSASEAGATRVPRALQELGVRFVVVPHLPQTKLDGAAAFANDGPIVALTMRYDRLDYFWFTLLHELAHLVLEHRGGHLDRERDGETISKEERDANKLAASWMFSDASIRALAKQQRLSRATIEEFSRTHKRHPALVVGRLHYLGLAEYSHFRAMLPKVRHHLAPWTDGATPSAE